ncbi:MAG: DUF935 domain-containing protein [Pseudomonadota bacterium]
MAKKLAILDHRGQPIKRDILTQEISGASITGVRSPISGYPADGLDPLRLGAILRQADHGDPIAYLELAETIEERDPHYQGVLGTRKRSVSQLPISIEAGEDTPLARKIADELEAWLGREELIDELFDVLDAVGKGYSHTEIIWDYSTGEYRPDRLEWRDPRWFRFDRINLKTPVMLDDAGREIPYPSFKFIYARIQAKSGLPLRSGLARVATWNWLFKAYTQRDWAIFTQTYGQPLRVGKFGPGASEKDQETLFRAVANIAGDCAAIIPESMMIEFIETGNLGASTDHYERRIDHLDKQISKAVLGQTATTDAETGGLGSGKEHREVQEDIETADARKLAAIINRDLVIPWVQLNWGPQAKYPRIKLARPEEEDLKHFAEAIAPLVDRGLPVSVSEVMKKFGLSQPEKDDQILLPTAKLDAQVADQPPTEVNNASTRRFKYPLNTLLQNSQGDTAAQSEEATRGALSASEEMAEVLAQLADRAMADVMAQIEAMISSAGSLEELSEMLLAAFPDLEMGAFERALAAGMSVADLAGRAALEAQSG